MPSDPDGAILPEDWDEVMLGIPETIELKRQMNFRLNAGVWRWFKAQGCSYQTRMNALPRAYMLLQRKKRQRS